MLSDKHKQEWLLSGVSETIIDRNVQTLEDPTDIDNILQRNVSDRWKHWPYGPGWCVTGVDPKTGERTLLGVQFKPDQPVFLEQKQDGTPKYRKYFSACEEGSNQPLFLDTGEIDYWTIIQNDLSIPISIVEGAKKAGALLSRGYAAISLPGVWNWGKSDRLKPVLKEFCKLKRTIYLAFDSDWQTNPGVFNALERLGRLLSAQGCWVYVLSWDNSLGKGIDDFIINGGDLKTIYDAALTFAEFRKLSPPKKQDSEYKNLASLDPLDEVINTTIDDHVFKRLFESGKGSYIVFNSAFYKYSGTGYWAHIDDEQVEKIIANYIRSAYKTKRNQKNEIVEVIFPYAKSANVISCFNFARTLLATDAQPYNKHLLCFQNCVVDLRTGETFEHNPNYYLTHALAANYEPGLPCPEAFGDFIINAYGEDLLEVIQAVTSMLLDPTAPYGQFVHCLGPSGSGKGTLLGVWSGMFAQENVRATASLSELNTPEGRYQNLTGTRFFICGDLGGYIQNIRAFFELVDNNPMSARALFSKRTTQQQFNTRFAIASVQPLQIENSGDGWDRRVIPLPTKQRKRPMDRYLRLKLAEERAAIISWALSMPRERRDWILNNLHEFDRIEEARGNAATAGDPVRSFVDFCLRPSPGDNRQIQSLVLHTWYSSYCFAFGYQKMGFSRFINHLKTVIPEHYKTRRRLSSSEDPNRSLVPSHWAEIEPVEGVFEELSEREDSCICVKRKCTEGGLIQFAKYKTTLCSDETISNKHEIDNQNNNQTINNQAVIIKGEKEEEGEEEWEEIK